MSAQKQRKKGEQEESGELSIEFGAGFDPDDVARIVDDLGDVGYKVENFRFRHSGEPIA